MANPVLNLSELNGSNGFVINGIDARDYSGGGSSAGDINGDGFDDLIIGAVRADPNGQNSAGESYVVFGSSSGFGAQFNLSSLNGSNGFVINGIDEDDFSGYSVSSAGDINGDGIDDLIIGASGADPNGQYDAGESYVVFGSSSGFDAQFNLSSLNGSNGFVINGIDEDDGSGISVSSAGDINGDGIDDLIIGAGDADPNGQNSAGESYVVFGSSSGFGAQFNLSSLNGSNGFVINGIDRFDFSGISVSSAGDINGDSFDDLIIGAYRASPNGQNNAGSSYVVFGSNSGFGASFNLSSLNGSNGFVINGIDADDRSGSSVSSAGDINGDGFDDLIIGEFHYEFYDRAVAGKSYVVFGSSSGFSAQLNLLSLNGSNGFVINGINDGDYSGRSVSSAGDINSDGFDDLIIGASRADRNSQRYVGQSYVIFGRSSGFGAGFNLSSLNGSEGFVINGIDAFDYSGGSVSNAGDINGDGFDDLIIGAVRADPNGQNSAGESYVVFGFASPTPTNKPPVAVHDTATTDEDTAVNIQFLANDSNFLTVTAINGRTVVVGTAITLSSGALLTLNADGRLTYNPNAQFESLAVGESGTDSFTYTINNGSLVNTASVNLTINGVNDAPQIISGFNLSSLNGSNGFVINGIDETDDGSGSSVSNAGDINGDGIDDLIIGAKDDSPNGQSLAGSSYVVFGSNSGFGASFNLSSLNGSNGFVINGIDADDRSGSSVSSAGDINGDGIDELIIGAYRASPNGQYAAGSSYVVFGSNSGFGASFNLSSLNGSNGFVINGIDERDGSGRSVSGAGDINGDGFDDLIIGAYGASPNGQNNAGSSYVVFGSNSGFSAQLNLSSLNGSNGFVINGIDAGDRSGRSVSSAGDINGDGFDDLIIGAVFADPNGQDRAGSSYVVFGSSSGFSAQLNLSSLNGSNGFVINGVDRFDLSGISVSGAGDINGDGFDDLIIGAASGFFDGQFFAGSSYVVFGSSSGFSAQLNLSSLNGSNGFVINTGSFVSSAGDINGDGFDDLIIGAPDAGAGSSYVVFGSSSGFSAQLNLSSLNGSNGFVINGIDAGDRSGSSVSSAGDINGDGFDDLIGIGALRVDPNGNGWFSVGSSYVVFGFQTVATTNEDTAVNILARNILRRYTDAEGNTLTISDFTNPTNGTLTLNDNATPDNPSDDFFIYTPNANFNGTDSFNFTVTDGNGGNITSTFNLNVKPVNDAPIAVNDRLTTGFNTPVTILTSTLLANDTDIDSNNLSITGVSGATNGTAVFSNNGTVGNSADDFIVFTPFNGFSGNANFNYTISDGNLSSTASVAIAVGANITGTNGNDNISGNGGNDNISGGNGNDTISGNGGNDTLVGGNGNDTFILGLGDGNDTITDFAGIRTGSNPSATVINQLDTLQFIGSGLTARNLQLTQNGSNLELTFLDATSTKVTLENFQLENLDNVPARGSRPAIGNILFDGQTSVTDSFDVFDANSTQTNLFNKNTVTFLNDLNNNVAGFYNSNDVINGQGGNDIINGNSGNDLLRGGEGDDILVGGQGNDVLVGGVGADFFAYNSNGEFTTTIFGIDTITDFNSSEGDKIVLDKTTFSAITSAVGTGFSNTNDFQITNLAGTSTATIVYNSVSGQLFYNQNGSAAGFGSGGLFATLTGAPTLIASDFLLQA
ncbi:tandem-95 repeat protein [Desmonostoc muscorum LEGE 12446]|nr:tandem-95 repeat protein [Desmonostoc muscorum]MCF2150954.1 tandem-95 repeat protein [Desmonostoc muscorum LEGE 12446]